MEKEKLCPHCTQAIYAYEYPLSRLIVSLLEFVESRGGTADVHQIKQQTGFAHNTSVASFHGMLENVGEHKWQITAKGRDFIHGKVKSPEYVCRFDHDTYGASAHMIGVAEARLIKTPYRKIEVSEDFLAGRRKRLFAPQMFP